MTTFADVLPVQRITSHKYSVTLGDEWCIGAVPNGGYVTSAFMLVASKHMQSTHAKRNQKNVINLHLEFVKKTQVGMATFVVEDIKIGSRISNLHITLLQKDEGTDEAAARVQGYIMMSNISAENGVSLASGHKLLPPPLPVSLSDLAQEKDSNYVRRGRDTLAHIRRAALHAEMNVSRPERRPFEFPKAMTDQWIRFRPNGKKGRLTNDALGFVVDIFPQVIELYNSQDLEEAILGKDFSPEEAKDLRQKAPPRKTFWYPTLNLNLDVKKVLPDEGVEWLFMRVQANKIHNGRFDLQITVLDDQGDLVALSSHASLAMDMSRNINRSTKKTSKI